MSDPKEKVIVHVVFAARVLFDQEVTMTRERFEKLNKKIDAGDDVDLFDYASYANPLDVEMETGSIDTFEIINPE